MFKDLTKTELALLKVLNTPKKIQNWLNAIPQNFDETLYSPRLVIKNKKAHCIEGALFAALALAYHGHKPYLLDLKASRKDVDHVVALFKVGNCWGAISKTNYPVLRFREAVYATIRELVMSYFHEYTDTTGSKTLRSYSKPFDVSKLDPSWVTSSEDLWDIGTALDESPHTTLFTNSQIKQFAKATQFEQQASSVTEWRK
jgi:hypothetical protein